MRVVVKSVALVAGALIAGTQLWGAGVALAQTGSIKSAPAPAASAKATPGSKSSIAEAKAECMQLWDAGTHMSRQQWSSTCDRIQSRLDSLKVENLDVMGTGVRKKTGSGKQGSIDRADRTS